MNGGHFTIQKCPKNFIDELGFQKLEILCIVNKPIVGRSYNMHVNDCTCSTFRVDRT